MLPSNFNVRLQQLEDNIKQDLVLLKEYEDAQRYEDEPRRKGRYSREIERQRESLSHYQKEYDDLQKQVTSEPPPEMQNVATQLQQMDAKVNVLLAGQAAVYSNQLQLRQTLLARFDATQQKTLAAIAERLDQNQLVTIEAVLEALEANQVSEAETRQLLEGTRQALTILKQRGVALPAGQEAIAEVINAPGLDAKHKLKVTAPIIPFLLEYEGELELGSGINLKPAWERLVARVRGK